ncbi:MAG: ComEC/Rec2 family competence protein [Chloroflexota bacterium]
MLIAWLAAAFVAGVVLGSSGLPFLLVIITPLVAALIIFLRRPNHAWVLLVGCCLCLGVLRVPHAGPATPRELRFYDGSAVSLTGVVSQEPDIRDTGANYVLTIQSIQRGTKTIPISGQLQLHTTSSEVIDYGDRVSLEGKLEAPVNGAVPYADILARRGIYSQMSYPRLLDLGPTSVGPLGWLVELRQHIEAGINRRLPEPEAALLIAITLGARSASLGDLAPILVATGLIHVIAISGIKVAMVAGTLYELARRLRSGLLTLFVSLLGLGGYVLLTGATASGLRSGIMWALVFIAVFLGRRTVALVSLGAAAAIMTLIDPSIVWDIGFQLSVVGTLAIVLFADPLLRVFRFLPSPLREAFCVSIAAQIGTFPIVISGFHLFSFTGPPANALVLPLLPFLIVAGFLLGVLSPLAPVGAALGAFTFALLKAIILLATALAGWRAPVPMSLSPLLSTAYYVVIIAAAYGVFRYLSAQSPSSWAHRGRELGISAAAVLPLGLLLVVAPVASAASLYSLGTGEAMLLREGGHTVLIDGSPRPFRLLERLGDLLPYRQRTIDLVVVTDPRAKNVSSLEAVLQHYHIGSVLDAGVEYPSGTYATWRADLRSRNIPVYRLQTGARIELAGMNLSSIGPDALYSLPQDSAGLLRLDGRGVHVLMAGVASLREQREAVFRNVRLPARTLIIDGKVGVDSSFLRAVHPTTIFSHSHLAKHASRHLLSEPLQIPL